MIDRPLRFCMITTFYPPYNFGGDGIFLHRLSNELARKGHKVDVIHCIDTYRLLGKQVPSKIRDNNPNVTVHGLKSPLGFFSPLATQQTGFPVLKSAKIRKILEKGFDVIHFHNISLVGGPKVLQYGKGIKLFTMHDYWMVCPTHTMRKFNRAVCTKPNCFFCTLTYKRPPQLWRYLGLLKSALNHVDALIAPSRFIKQIHHRLNLSIPTVYLPNFVPSLDSRFPKSEQAAYETPEKPFFLFVGRLEKPKGLQTLIPVFRHYRKAQLLIAGTGSYESRLRYLAEGNANIQFLGHLSDSQLKALYQKAIAVIVPSIWFENFPLVILEAFRQQTPAIVRNLGAMSEIIKESGGGFVYDSREELVEAMDRLLTDSSFRQKTGLNCYQTFQNKWTAEAHLKQYFQLIQKISKTHGKKTL